MSDILDIIPMNDICNKKSDYLNENDKKIEEEYEDIIDNNLSKDNKIKNKNNIPKLLIIILCYLNYVNYKKKNVNFIKSKL
jgi:hypothetical protein